MNSALLADGYKTGHHQQYPTGTTKVYSNFTPRSNSYAPKECTEVVVFGTQMMVQQLHDHFQLNFFDKSKKITIDEIKTELSLYLGYEYDVKHFEDLWDLGFLPIEIKALEEGTLCPIKVPMLTIHNTLPEFYWITNYLETIISNLLWKPITSASLAYQYKKLLKKWALKTDENNIGFVDFQGHDFSMRGLDSIEATISSGLGHLTSFLGSDSLPTIYGARKYYDEKGFVTGSVPATEHSVMCAGGKESEIDTFRRLLQTYKEVPVLSVVSDTWDLWYVLTVILPQLKEEILSRKGKLVIRPDSGDPVDIICGKELVFSHNNADGNGTTLKQNPNENERFGVIELLWNVFGGTVNEQGYKVLDSHIGAIYGDSINIDRAEQICSRLEAKGFASTNIVLGIGSFTYQYNTRDTFGFAMKATYVEKEVEIQVGTTPENIEWDKEIQGFEIFKNPVTDDGIKKSAVGLLRVFEENGTLKLQDKCTWEEENTGLLKVIYEDGIQYNKTTLTEIRERLNG